MNQHPHLRGNPAVDIGINRLIELFQSLLPLEDLTETEIILSPEGYVQPDADGRIVPLLRIGGPGVETGIHAIGEVQHFQPGILRQFATGCEPGSLASAVNVGTFSHHGLESLISYGGHHCGMGFDIGDPDGAEFAACELVAKFNQADGFRKGRLAKQQDLGQ